MFSSQTFNILSSFGEHSTIVYTTKMKMKKLTLNRKWFWRQKKLNKENKNYLLEARKAALNFDTFEIAIAWRVLL